MNDATTSATPSCNLTLRFEPDEWTISVAVIARRLRSIVGAMWSEAYCNEVAAKLAAKEGE
jgi:hypothetical protein